MPKSNKVSNKSFWNERYLKGNMPWDIGEATPVFIKYFNENKNISSGVVGVLGCGRGHDAFFFESEVAESEDNYPCFQVYGFDFSDSAIKFCNNLKQKNNLKNIYFYQIDFFNLLKDKKWKNLFDYLIEHTSLCAIDPSLRKKYVDLIKYLLKPSGKLIGMFFIRPLKLGGPPFGSTPKEIRELFKEDFIEIEKLRYAECLHKGKLDGDEYFGVFEKKIMIE